MSIYSVMYTLHIFNNLFCLRKDAMRPFEYKIPWDAKSHYKIILMNINLWTTKCFRSFNEKFDFFKSKKLCALQKYLASTPIHNRLRFFDLTLLLSFFLAFSHNTWPQNRYKWYTFQVLPSATKLHKFSTFPFSVWLVLQFVFVTNINGKITKYEKKAKQT